MARHSSHILALARKGAEHRLQELQSELVVLIRQFPHLKSGHAGKRGRPQIDISAEPAATIDRPQRKRRGMSAAARKAVSERMTKYWAARRAGRKK
jgi:hypothetical protein